MAFREIGIDHVKSTMSNKTGRLRRMTIDQGLLKETVLVQKLIGSLLKCNVSWGWLFGEKYAVEDDRIDSLMMFFF